MRVLRPSTASKTMSPPLPPSPPSGPPYSTYFSRRKLTAPGPPAPERMKILAWSRKCMAGHVGQPARNLNPLRAARVAPRRCPACRRPSRCTRFPARPSGFSKPGGGEQQPADDLARLAAIEAERFRHLLPKQRIAHRDEDDPQGRFGHRPVLMAGAEVIDELVDRLQHRVQRVAIARKDHPGGERAGALLAEGVEDAVDDLDRVGLVRPGAPHRFLDAGADSVADQLGQRRLQAGGRAEMVE